MKSGGGGGGGGGGGKGSVEVSEATEGNRNEVISSNAPLELELEHRSGNDGPPPLSAGAAAAAAAASENSLKVHVDVVQQPQPDPLSGSLAEAATTTATSATTATTAATSSSSSSDPQSNAFGQLVKAWEKYMDDTPQVDPFETLKKLQNLHLFGPAAAAASADSSGTAATSTTLPQLPQLNPNDCVYGYYPYASSFAAAMMPGMHMAMGQHPHPLAPPALRHTHSSPLQRATSVLDNHFLDSSASGPFGYTSSDGNDNGVMPPPIPLDPFQRSSSTPSAFRTRSVNSAFGTVPHTHVGSGLGLTDYSIRGTGEASASYTNTYYAHDPSVPIRASAFDPVKYYARALQVQEDMERTSIEVMDMTTTSTSTETTSSKTKSVDSPDTNKAPAAAAARKEFKVAASTTDDSSEAFTTADSVTTTNDETMATKNNIFKRGAGSRAERFLSNVRVLRRRRRTTRGGRENPAQPASVSSSSNSSSQQNESTSTSSCASNSTAQGKSRKSAANASGGAGSGPVLVTTTTTTMATSPSPSTESSTQRETCTTTVTVVTEPDYNPNDTSMLSQSSELSAIVKGAGNAKHDAEADADATRQRSQDSKDSSCLDVMTKSPSANISTYQQLDSDADEDEVRYQNIGVTTESPVPSPSYQMIHDGRSAKETLSGKQTLVPLVSPSGGGNKDLAAVVASPSPTRMSCGHDHDPNTPPQGTPPSSHDSVVTASPQTARSSNTGSSSSGHTTQAASTSSGHPSVLSTISETDREVMEANKEAKRRRGLQGLRNLPQLQKNADPADDSVRSSSTNSNSTNPHRYLALQNTTSPVALREGANVPVDRFFIDEAATANGSSSSGIASANANNSHHPTTAQRSQSTRSQSTTTSGSRPSGRTGSPATLGSFSASSSSGTQEEPPTFVSYMDRQGASDLTSLREETEASSKRAAGVVDNNEEREGSPAELEVGYQEVVFQEAQPKAIRPDRIRGRLDKFRTRPARPPRSPVKGCRPATTPPPRGHSPICHTALSPPRDIVDHPHSNISKPFVMRMGRSNLVGATKTATTATATTTTASAVENMIGLTYAESSIEVLQAELSSDEMQMSNVNIVTPEKGGSSA